jgi:hypothetical protein
MLDGMSLCIHDIDTSVSHCADCGQARHPLVAGMPGPGKTAETVRGGMAAFLAGGPAPGRPGYGPWFPAGHPGACDGGCGGEIVPGDLIRADGAGGWLCRDCGADDAAGAWLSGSREGRDRDGMTSYPGPQGEQASSGTGYGW